MRNAKTRASFWREAASRLPPEVRQRYAAEFERAERWELTVDSIIETARDAYRLLRRPHRLSASSSSSG
jgi:hypothetical protein